MAAVKLHSGMFNETLRSWQSSIGALTPNNLMLPLFIIEDDNDEVPIKSMPGVSRFGLNKLKIYLEPLVKAGLTSVLLFGVIEKLEKNDVGINAVGEANPVIRALPKLRSWFPSLTIACDICLCPYTYHGHCGILYKDGTINNSASIKRIAEVALEYAKAGAHIVAPSDMMDGRIGAIKEILRINNLDNKVAVLSYGAKFASCFYGPFRDAALSKPAFGDRKSYQLPTESSGLALRAIKRDVKEGADMLMVKPGLAYLDIVKETKKLFPNHPLFIYQVSGEYSMLYHGAAQGAFDLKIAILEILSSMRRAGADVIITYYTPEILNLIGSNRGLKSKY